MISCIIYNPIFFTVCYIFLHTTKALRNKHEKSEHKDEDYMEFPAEIDRCPIHITEFWWQIILKREEARLSSFLLNIICCQIWYQLTTWIGQEILLTISFFILNNVIGMNFWLQQYMNSLEPMRQLFAICTVWIWQIQLVAAQTFELKKKLMSRRWGTPSNQWPFIWCISDIRDATKFLIDSSLKL